MASNLAARDERLETLFNVEHEATSRGRPLVDDPYPTFNRMRSLGPVQPGNVAEHLGIRLDAQGHNWIPGRPAFTAYSFKAVNDAFMDNKTYSSELYLEFGVKDNFGDSILSMVGERHRRYRDLIQPHFQPGVAAGWWNDRIIVGPVEELVSSIEKKGSANLISEFFGRLPMFVVTAGFGLSAEEGIEFRANLETASSDIETPEARARAKEAYLAVLRRVVEARQKEPRDDIISKLAQARLKPVEGGERDLSTQEILDYCRLIVFAGGGTTWRQLSITMYALLENPKQLEAVRGDRSLIPQTILESARWQPTDPVFPRGVTRDTVLEGVALPKGAILQLCLGAANRDPSRWKDPDVFEIHRPLQRSVAFGTGAHSCLGQHVSRQEMTAALNAVLDRLPGVRWDASKPAPRLWGGLNQRGPTALPVVFG